MPSLEIFKVVLVQCNLVDNQNQQKTEVLYTFTPNKPYAYLLNVEWSNLVFLKTYNTEFDEIIITFTDQNDRPLKIKKKFNLTLLINIWKWYVILWNQQQENFTKDMGFSHLQEIYLTNTENNYWILLLKQN